MTLTETEDRVLKLAVEHLGLVEEVLSGKRNVTLEDKLSELFTDSLEYLDFTLRLGEFGHLSEEAIGQAETLEDLANAIVHPN